MSLYIDMKMVRSLNLRLNVTFLHHVLDFLEKHQRGVPWENLPLEHDWFSNVFCPAHDTEKFV